MAAKAKTTSKSKAPAEPLVAYKGFNRDLTCNPNGKPFKYEIGKTYRLSIAGDFIEVETPEAA